MNDIDCSQLCDGLVVKNYREMCLLLNEQENAGNSKKSQIKRWKRFFAFKREGQKFIVTKVYDNPLKPIIVRRNKKGVYFHYIKPLLLRLLAENEYGLINTSKKMLYDNLGMINVNYTKYSPKLDFGDDRKNVYNDNILALLIDDIKRFAGITVDRENIDYFYSVTEKKLNSILNSSIKSMQAKLLITCLNNYIIYKNGEEFSADNEQATIINEVHDIVLENMGMKNIRNVIIEDRIKEFYRRVNAMTKDKYEWQAVVSNLIIVSLSNIAAISDKERDSYRKELNRVVMNYFEQDILAKKEKYGNGEWGTANPMRDNTNPKKVKIIQRENFIDVQRCLLDYLVKI